MLRLPVFTLLTGWVVTAIMIVAIHLFSLRQVILLLVSATMSSAIILDVLDDHLIFTVGIHHVFSVLGGA